MLGAAPRICALAFALLCTTVLGAAASNASASVRAGADARLPKTIWAIELDRTGRVDRATLRKYRSEGLNAGLVDMRRVSKRRLAAMRRGASRAGLLLLTSRVKKASA